MSDLLPLDQASRSWRDRLQRAVRSEEVPPYLESRIRHSIRSSKQPVLWLRRLVPVGAALAVCLGAAIAYQLGHLRLTAASQEAYVVAMSNRVGTLMRIGLGDHIHCSVFGKNPQKPPSFEEVVQEANPKYRELVEVARAKVPAEYHLWTAHECRYHGRRFVHLSFGNGLRLVSLVISKKGDGESFETENLLPALAESGIPIYRAGVQRFEIAALESRDHLVYVVSDLPKEKNLDMMQAMAPGIKGFLAKLEI